VRTKKQTDQRRASVCGRTARVGKKTSRHYCGQFRTSVG